MVCGRDAPLDPAVSSSICMQAGWCRPACLGVSVTCKCGASTLVCLCLVWTTVRRPRTPTLLAWRTATPPTCGWCGKAPRCWAARPRASSWQATRWAATSLLPSPFARSWTASASPTASCSTTPSSTRSPPPCTSPAPRWWRRASHPSSSTQPCVCTRPPAQTARGPTRCSVPSSQPTASSHAFPQPTSAVAAATSSVTTPSCLRSVCAPTAAPYKSCCTTSSRTRTLTWARCNPSASCCPRWWTLPRGSRNWF
mmetsp:Transcript_798/g.1852  ORF Transcript_798/g.1852 Transcript_798/m.1852 type:complete len:254 (+) Transcript_798:174-935(+)